jgi:hypothetical protein
MFCETFLKTGVDRGFPMSQNVSLWRRLSRRKGVRHEANPRHFRVLNTGIRYRLLLLNRRSEEHLRHNNYQAAVKIQTARQRLHTNRTF